MKLILRKIGFFTAFILPALVVAGYYGGGWWNALTLVFSFLFIPLIDQAIGPDPSNVPPDQTRAESDSFYYRFVLYCWVYIQVALIAWQCFAVTTGRISAWYEWMAFVLSTALVTGGIGITVAHELGHKHSSLQRFYAKVLLMTVGYMHFYIEHNRGHHVNVATPSDPATARRHESFYRFWVRSVFGGYVDAWRLEKKRLERLGKNFVSLHNQMIIFTLVQVGFVALMTMIVGYASGGFMWQVPVFLTAQGIAAFTLLELVNYVEHYGITRREIAPGKYERVNPLHSWNASHLLSNFFLFQLQRHSDHHVYAYKPYQVLNHYDESPQLPFGYPTMILIALVPPLWFAVMDARLMRWEAARTEVAVE